MNSTIALVNVQIGPYKNYSSFFFNSCKENSDIDFYFFTDQKINIPSENIHIINVTFEEIKAQIQDLYDFPICLSSPYDLCDYKVVYGELFSDYLKKYDFWGYCDTDMIFGNIRYFLTEDILSKYDKILIRGHFTLFRNNTTCFNCYRLPLADGRLRFKEVFSEDGIHHFDEGMPELVEGINMIFFQNFGWDKVYDKYVFMDLDIYSWEFINSDLRKKIEEKKSSQNSFFRWENGILERVKIDKLGSVIEVQPYMYIHFQKRKMKVCCSAEESLYYMIPNKFIGSSIDIKRLYHANESRIYWKRLFERIRKKFFIKKGKIL